MPISLSSYLARPLPIPLHLPTHSVLYRWPGGKNYLTRALMRFRPSRCAMVAVPFSGGLSFPLHFLRLREPPAVVIADTFEPLINCCLVLQRDGMAVARKLAGICDGYEPDARALYEHAIDVLENSTSDFDRAVAFYIFNRLTWTQGLLAVSKSSFSPSQVGRGLTLSQISRIPLLAELLRKADIRLEDYRETMARAAAYGRDAFLPLDPPYTGMDQLLYNCDFDQNEFRQHLAETPCQWLLTLDTTDEALRRYQGCRRVFHDIFYTASKKRATEQVVFNYEPPFLRQTVAALGWMDEPTFMARRHMQPAANDNETLARSDRSAA